MCNSQASWWRHQMETFSALLALCAGNSPATGNSPHKASDAELLYFLWSAPEKTVEQTIVRLVTRSTLFDSLSPQRCGSIFTSGFFKLTWGIDILITPCEICPGREPLKPIDDQSTLVQVMACAASQQANPDICRHRSHVATVSWQGHYSRSVLWWRHQMETFSALLALCAGNSSVTGEFPTQRPVAWSFDVFVDLCLNKRLSEQSWDWWFETPSRWLWSHRNVKKKSEKDIAVWSNK